MANKHKLKDEDAFIRQMMTDDDTISSKEAENIESFMQAMDAWDEDDLAPSAGVKKQLMADFKAQHSKDRLVWLNSFWLLLWPKDKSWYQTPGVQLLSMATIVLVAVFVFNNMDKDLEKSNNLAENESSDKTIEQVQDEKLIDGVKSAEVASEDETAETLQSNEDHTSVKQLEVSEEAEAPLDRLKTETDDLVAFDQSEISKDVAKEVTPAADGAVGGLPKGNNGIADNNRDVPAPAEGYSFNSLDNEKSDKYGDFNDGDMAFGSGGYDRADDDLSKNDMKERGNKKSLDRNELTSDITVIDAESVNEELADEVEATVTYNNANSYSGNITTSSVATGGSLAFKATINSVKAAEDADLFDYLYTAE